MSTGQEPALPLPPPEYADSPQLNNAGQIFHAIEHLDSDNPKIRSRAERHLRQLQTSLGISTFSELLPQDELEESKWAEYRIAAQFLEKSPPNQDDPMRDQIAAALTQIIFSPPSKDPRLLKHRSQAVRSALPVLWRLAQAESVPIIIVAASDQDAKVRTKAADVLGKTTRLLDGHPQKEIALVTLSSLLSDPKSEVRVATIHSLTKIHDFRSVPFLINKLNTATGVEMCAIIHALGIFGHPDAVPHLVDIMNTSLANWARMDEWATPFGVNALKSLAEIGHPAATPHILRLLEHQRDPWVRRKLVENLGLLGDPQVIPTLIQIIKYDSSLAYEAIEALENISHPKSSKPPLAYPYLEDLKDPEIIPIMANFILETRYIWYKTKAIRILGQLGDSLAVPILEQTAKLFIELPDPSWQDYYQKSGLEELAAALKEIAYLMPDGTAIAALRRLADSPHSVTREIALNTLEAIKQEWQTQLSTR